MRQDNKPLQQLCQRVDESISIFKKVRFLKPKYIVKKLKSEMIK